MHEHDDRSTVNVTHKLMILFAVIFAQIFVTISFISSQKSFGRKFYPPQKVCFNSTEISVYFDQIHLLGTFMKTMIKLESGDEW